MTFVSQKSTMHQKHFIVEFMHQWGRPAYDFSAVNSSLVAEREPRMGRDDLRSTHKKSINWRAADPLHNGDQLRLLNISSSGGGSKQ